VKTLNILFPFFGAWWISSTRRTKQTNVNNIGGIKVQTNISLTWFMTVVFFFILVSVNFDFCSAQDGLQITGPTETFEQEPVEYTITQNGIPVQARVTCEGITLVQYSNESTGKVSFNFPSVPTQGSWFTISASMLDGASASFEVFVRNHTKRLILTTPQFPIPELSTCLLIVSDGSNPVSDATIWFASETYLTDSHGEALLNTPDVLLTTTYAISVNKTGYQPASSTITIRENGRGIQLMQISAPSIVEPGQQILISVVSAQGGLANATVTLIYDEDIAAENTTDDFGEAILSIPIVEDGSQVLLSVGKEGYATYEETEQSIYVLTQNYTRSLRLQADSSEVIEGTTMMVTVTDNLGLPVQGVQIWRGNIQISEPTDVQGVLFLSVPYVFFDEEFFIYALKAEYNFAELSLTVRNQESSAGSLVVQVNRTVNESELFTVLVSTDTGVPVQDASVFFYLLTKETDVVGEASFFAPLVLNDTFYSIDVSKTGYTSASVFIEVLDTCDTGTDNSSTILQICIAPRIAENTLFEILVRDGSGYPLMGVLVSFSGVTKTTNFQGIVQFTAPDVMWDSYESVLATKTGYVSASTRIGIISTQDFPFWPLIILVVLVFGVGVVAYLRFRRH